MSSRLSDNLTPAPDIIVVCGGATPIATVQNAHRAHPASSIILCHDQVRPNELAGALRIGLFDYVRTSATQAAWFGTLSAALRRHSQTAPPLSRCGTEKLIGQAPSIEALRTRILNAARSDSTVLITGETGTGKELIAELIHENSPRSSKPLVCLNCAALPETLVESELFGHERGAFTGAYAMANGKLLQATGGTLFLDEAGELPLAAQAKLLRALDGRQVYRLGGRTPVPHDTRIIAATNRDLEHQASSQQFRSDLYFRLNVVRIETPPLREHLEDIPLLVAALFADFNKRFQMRADCLGAASMQLLLSYHWPGNVRELRNWVEAAFVNAPSRHADHLELPDGILAYFEKLDAATPSERDQLLQALVACGWNRTRAAESLCWSRMTVHRKMRQYGIVRECDARASA